MKFLLISLVATLLSIAQPVLATSQEPDTLVLEGEQLSLETNPLSPLIQSKPDASPCRNQQSYGPATGVVTSQLGLSKTSSSYWSGLTCR
jgi:hypothetical protein